MEEHFVRFDVVVQHKSRFISYFLPLGNNNLRELALKILHRLFCFRRLKSFPKMLRYLMQKEQCCVSIYQLQTSNLSANLVHWVRTVQPFEVYLFGMVKKDKIVSEYEKQIKNKSCSLSASRNRNPHQMANPKSKIDLLKMPRRLTESRIKS